jgi:hypothetical protein
MVEPLLAEFRASAAQETLGLQAGLMTAVVVERDRLARELLTCKACKHAIGAEMLADVIGSGPKRWIVEANGPYDCGLTSPREDGIGDLAEVRVQPGDVGRE